MIILSWIFRLLASILIFVLLSVHSGIFGIYRFEDLNGMNYIAGFILIFVILTILQISFLELRKLFRWLAMLYPTTILATLFRIGVEAQGVTEQNKGCLVFVLIIGLILSGGLSLIGAMLSLVFMWLSGKLAKRK